MTGEPDDLSARDVLVLPFRVLHRLLCPNKTTSLDADSSPLPVVNGPLDASKLVAVTVTVESEEEELSRLKRVLATQATLR